MRDGRQDTRPQFDANTAPWAEFISKVHGDSKTVPLPLSGECDLVFIDGDHSYEGTRADVTRYGPLVRIGGRIVFHDHDHIPITRVIGEELATGCWAVTRCYMQIMSLQRVR